MSLRSIWSSWFVSVLQLSRRNLTRRLLATFSSSSWLSWSLWTSLPCTMTLGNSRSYSMKGTKTARLWSRSLQWKSFMFKTRVINVQAKVPTILILNYSLNRILNLKYQSINTSIRPIIFSGHPLLNHNYWLLQLSSNLFVIMNKIFQ